MAVPGRITSSHWQTLFQCCMDYQLPPLVIEFENISGDRYWEKFEDNKGSSKTVNWTIDNSMAKRIREKKVKQWSTKHYTEN